MKDHQILGLLERAYAAEHETVENYLANSVWLDGLRAEEIKQALAQDVSDELGHAQRLAHRMKELHHCPPGSMKLERTQKQLQPPADPTDMIGVVRGVVAYETEAIDLYNEIIRQCEGQDYVTQDMAIHLLADEEKHRTLFEGFLRSLERHDKAA